MAVGPWHGLLCGLICAAAAATAAAEEGARPAGGPASEPVRSRLYEALSQQLGFIRRGAPAWIREQSRLRLGPGDRPDAEAVQLVIQQERPDGTELLTLRYALAEHGTLRAYAGAGLNRAAYYSADDAGASDLSRRQSDRSVGAAAELGAEFRASDRLLVSADLRWAELDADAARLASDDMLVGADRLALGVSLGWRFR